MLRYYAKRLIFDLGSMRVMTYWSFMVAMVDGFKHRVIDQVCAISDASTVPRRGKRLLTTCPRDSRIVMNGLLPFQNRAFCRFRGKTIGMRKGIGPHQTFTKYFP